MTSIEIAILVAIVLAIAVAVAWYLYTTYVASVGSQPLLRVVSATAFANGTIKVEVMNTGSTAVGITHAEVFGTTFRVRNGYVWVGPSAHIVVNVDTGRWIRPGSIIQGRLITEGGHSIPFSAKTPST